MMKSRVIFTAILAGTALTGCINMPTPVSQITGAYVSPVMYETYDCHRLGIELGSLSRRENQLATAQDQRMNSSMVQAFLIGAGSGDGIEASELANVRGQREAVISAMEQKSCVVNTVNVAAK